MTEPIWLANARADLGIKEIPGSKAHDRILEIFAQAGHPEIQSDEISWCGAFVAAHLKACGYPIVPEPLVARNWRKYGEPLDVNDPASFRPGAIAVFWREHPNSWKGHVGFVVGATKTRVKVLGGNQSNSVTILSLPKSQLLAVVWPVKATVKELEVAGSTEVKAARKTSAWLWIAGLFTALVNLVESFSVMDVLNTTGEHLSALMPALEAADAVIRLLAQNQWLLTLVALAAGWGLSRFVLKHRVERHHQGQPLSRAG